MAEDMATFCLATGHPPQIFLELTRLERQAFKDVIAQKRRR